MFIDQCWWNKFHVIIVGETTQLLKESSIFTFSHLKSSYSNVFLFTQPLSPPRKNTSKLQKSFHKTHPPQTPGCRTISRYCCCDWSASTRKHGGSCAIIATVKIHGKLKTFEKPWIQLPIRQEKTEKKLELFSAFHLSILPEVLKFLWLYDEPNLYLENGWKSPISWFPGMNCTTTTIS